jgi:Na+-driven multidrug efflux pump
LSPPMRGDSGGANADPSGDAGRSDGAPPGVQTSRLKELVVLGLPMSLTGFFTVSLPLVSLVFGGHLGRQQLAAVGLATLLANVTGSR